MGSSVAAWTFAKRGALALVILSGSACATTSGKLRAQFAHEHACPESEVGVRELGANVYAAEGCGKRAEYVCGMFATMGGNPTCAERGLARQAPAGGDRRPFPEGSRVVQPPNVTPVTPP